MSEQNLVEPAAIRERMAADGFCGPLDAGVSQAQCAMVARAIEAMIDGREAHPLYRRFSVRDWHLLNRDFLDLLTAPKVLRAVSTVLGDSFKLWRSKIFLKAPGEAPLGWHQEWGAFNGEEIGNDVPALVPAAGRENSAWNLTVWMPLSDVDPTMGPIRFARGSHRRRFPIEMRPLTEAEFYVDPFREIHDFDELVARIRDDSLCLDIPTASYLDDVDPRGFTFDQLCAFTRKKLEHARGAVTLDFHEEEQDIVSLPMRAGEFVIFSERCMHGSSANLSPRNRIGINARFTFSDTTIYPVRNTSTPIDGSNLDISDHRSVQIGEDRRYLDSATVRLSDLQAELSSIAMHRFEPALGA
ncbi:phytanoyl-CoA dioxygenase family protein [uncultured Sphingomonas sp.]|uniref:phytanoyl-CoA dioxygenase family protein n=1 Tax=uncultured Sphingomonas sp. TaxID=158754 RepID=UPI0025F4D63C|nr:phytanoyl-CoA dioxygenase family protein [uncultured Sphingomonas sp.]